MATEDLCERGQEMFSEGFSKCSDEQKRNELSLLFLDLISAVHRTELEPSLREGYDALRTSKRERERETGPTIETALKTAVGG